MWLILPNPAEHECLCDQAIRFGESELNAASQPVRIDGEREIDVPLPGQHGKAIRQEFAQ